MLKKLLFEIVRQILVELLTSKEIVEFIQKQSEKKSAIVSDYTKKNSKT